MSTQEQMLDTCGCCEGITQLTPQDLTNLPGLSALAYRVGTHGSFKTSMLATVSGPDGLDTLTTRHDDDPAIALLDAAATMLDVLTFYQERIANEGFLRTATERASVLELARAIGYELNPGVAASTFLAFEMETAPGAPISAVIPVGTKVQSLPGQDEQPQTFETVKQIEARTVWNRLKAQTAKLTLPKFGDTELYLQGTTTNLKPGDALLLIGDERKNAPGNENWDFRRITAVKLVPATDPAAAYTVVTLERGLGAIIPHTEPARRNPTVYALRLRANLFGSNAPDWRSMPKSVQASYTGLPENTDFSSIPEWPRFTIADISAPPSPQVSGGLLGEYFDDLNFQNRKLFRNDSQINFVWTAAQSPDPRIAPGTFSIRWTGWVEPKVSGLHTFRVVADDGVRLWVDGKVLINPWHDQVPTSFPQTVSLFAGHRYTMQLEYYNNTGPGTIQLFWSAPNLPEEIIPASQLYPRDINNIHLDAVYPQILVGSWVVLSIPDYQEVYSVEQAAEDARANFTLSAKTTRLILKGENLLDIFNDRLRQTQVFAQSEALPMAAQPIPDPLQGDTIVLDQLLLGLQEQRTLIVTGKRMRVHLLQEMMLRSADGSQSVRANVGDSLILTQTPVTLPSGQVQWTLTDKNSFTGSVTLDSRVATTNLWQLSPAEANDALVSEVATIKTVLPNSDPTTIVLTASLTYSYDRTTVFTYSNVARATHGETRREVLGSGNAAQTFQAFGLKQTPLTYVSAPTASGAQTTLQIRINDVLWEEATSLYQLVPRDRDYITRRDDNGKTTVQFGDGINGARVPTGDENVTAVYRTGTGTAGMVKAGQLSLLMTRPLGVQRVTNPLAPTGAADPEDRDRARQNAPFTVLTLDRVVSLKDFEDFARAFAGIGKAQATVLWDGEKRLVYLTIAATASTNGIDYSVDPRSTLFQNLRLAIDAARDTVQPLEIASYEPLIFKLEAHVLVDPAYIPEKVLAAVTTAVQQTYAFAQRHFGQSVHASEVLAIIQHVTGVKAAFVEKLYFKGDAIPKPQTLLPARGAIHDVDGKLKPAQMLLVDPNGNMLTEFKP